MHERARGHERFFHNSSGEFLNKGQRNLIQEETAANIAVLVLVGSTIALGVGFALQDLKEIHKRKKP